MSLLTLPGNFPSHGKGSEHGERQGETIPSRSEKQSGHVDPRTGEHSWTASYECSLEDCLIVKYLYLYSG